MTERINETTHGSQAAKAASLIMVARGYYIVEITPADTALTILTRAGLDPRIHSLRQPRGGGFPGDVQIWEFVEDGGWLLALPASLKGS